MERKDLVVSVVEAAHEFVARELWTRFSNFDCFALKLPHEDNPILGVILGGGGEEYGLTLFRGPDATCSFSHLLELDGLSDEGLEDADILGFSMGMFGTLPPDCQALVRQCGLHPRCDEPAPGFLSKPAGMIGRVPDESECGVLLAVLRAVIAADKEGLLQPGKLGDKKGICVLELGDDPDSPLVSVTREQWKPQASPVTIPLFCEDFELDGLARLKTTWLVGMPPLPVGVEGDDRSMRLVLVVDDTNDMILQGKPVFVTEMREAVEALVEVFNGLGMVPVKGLPRKIVFSSPRLYEVVSPALRRYGVKCVFSADVPKLSEILEGMYDLCDRYNGFLDGDPQFFETPANDDLDGWKAANKRLAGRFLEHFEEEDRLWSSRPVKRYFGEDDLDFYLDEFTEQGVALAYATWGVLDYRPTRNSKTQAEKMLADGLPQPDAIVLRARMQSHPSLYQIIDYDPDAGTIEVEDILLGGRVTICDQLLSENTTKNSIMTARVFAAGDFHFIEMVGPPLSSMMATPAIGFLTDSGVKFTRQALQRDAHKLGWLWGWLDEQGASFDPARFRNTDGDQLLWHTASFSIADQSEVREAFVKRADIEHNEETDEFAWVRSGDIGPGAFSDFEVLSIFEFVGDELVLTTDSAERFAAVREWLEKLPGVVFCGVKTRDLTDFEEDRPLDERISEPEPVEMTSELVAALQEKFDRHYMEWIDTPLPALNHLTPRQACLTEDGRRQVAMLIRAIPEPMGPVELCIPRDAMRRELGLAGETPIAGRAGAGGDEPAIPIVPVDSYDKIGRNAPCPCGSGRKYKKCCGRQEGAIGPLES